MLFMKFTTHLYLAGFLLLCIGRVSAQGLCNNGGGGFSLSANEICAGRPITISNTPGNAVDIGYVTSYTGATTGLAFNDLKPNLTVTYTLPGMYTILQKIVTNSGQVGYHCEKVKVFESRRVNVVQTACGGGNINLALTNDAILAAYNRVEIDWGDGTEPEYWEKGKDLNMKHPYANINNKYTIKVKGLHAEGSACIAGTENIIQATFVEANLSNIQVTSLEMKSSGSLSYSYVGIGGIKTEVQHSADNGNTFQKGINSSATGPLTFPIAGLNPQGIYKVKLLSEDRCGGAVSSEVVTSMKVDAKPERGTVNIKWNKYTVEAGWEFEGYDLYANNEVIKTFTSSDDVEYTDNDVECGYSYSYKIAARLKRGNASFTSTSSEVGVRVENDGTETISRASVSVNADKVLILADVPGKTYTLQIERAESGGNSLFRRIVSLDNESEYLDSGVQTAEKSYCYKFSFQACGRSYPATQPICTILLQKTFSTFSWSDDQPFFEPAEKYTMIQTASSGKVDEIEQKPNLTFTPMLGTNSDSEYTFQIKASADNGALESLSNSIVYKRNPEVFVPTAFTPNDDFKNDELKPIAEQLKSYSFTVFNRTGEVVFHTTDQAVGWNGKVKNTIAQLGWYVYKIGFVDDLDQKVEKSGTFMLLR
jgi:gliding motility-associated-like protein